VFRDEEFIVAEAQSRRPADAPDPVTPEQLARWGVSLREAMKSIGGVEGVITSPVTGTEYAVSLAPWAGRDLDETFVRLAFKNYDPNRAARRRL
jgi:hypothetical protein